MAQIDDFFMYENRVEGITDADYLGAQPYVEAAQAFAQTTYQSIYIIDYFKKNFLYVSDFLCAFQDWGICLPRSFKRTKIKSCWPSKPGSLVIPSPLVRSSGWEA